MHLPRYDVWALPRHTEVKAALRSWQTFTSAEGVGLNDTINEVWRDGVLLADPPLHNRLRSVLNDRLAPRALADLKPDIERQAEAFVGALLERDGFDAVDDLARAFPVSVVMDLIGFPEEGRDRLLGWAEGAFNSVGPPNERCLASFPALRELQGWLAGTCTREKMMPGGLASTVFDAADRGDIDHNGVLRLLGAYSTPALDTTINALGSAIMLFARNPEQWDVLRDDPSLARSAFNEVLRLESPIQMFARTTRTEVHYDDGTVPAGSKVLMMFASANRDERQFRDPERFDIRRDNGSSHLAFGFGIHGCPGQGLSRLEAISLLTALAERVTRFEIVGEPRRELNNVTRGFSALPVVALR